MLIQTGEAVGCIIGVSVVGSFVINAIRAPKLLHEELQAEHDRLLAEMPNTGSLKLLAVDFGFHYNLRDDLGNPITISPNFRNGYGFAVAVRAIRWRSQLSSVSGKLVENGLALRDTSSMEWIPRRGAETIVVPPNGVFRATVETQHASRKGLALLRDKHGLGALTLLVDDREVTFKF